MRTLNGQAAGTTLFLAFAWFVPGAISRFVWIVDPEPRFAYGMLVLDCGVAACAGVALAYLLAVVAWRMRASVGGARHGG